MKLHRSYVRKWVIEGIESAGARDERGRFIDPATNTPIKGKYDLGHVAGHEFWREARRAEEEGLTQKEFNDRMNNPDLYRLENPSSNRSHSQEDQSSYEEWKSAHEKASKRSSAEKAYDTQGVKKDGQYPGHDVFQNGVIKHGEPFTIYTTRWDEKQLDSGFFTDQGEIDRCTHDGRLNNNELGDRLQTSPSNRDTAGGDYQQKPICRAYTIDWDRLDELKTENPRIYNSLTNPDGLSEGGNDIKCAFGKVEANPQYGKGGANQYYIDKELFNEAKNAGVFKIDEDKSFSEAKGNLVRENIPNTKEYASNVAAQKDKVAEKESRKKEPTAQEINSQKAADNPENPYIAKPDPAYGYDENKKSSDNEKKSDRQSSKKSADDQKTMPSKSAGEHKNSSEEKADKMPSKNASEHKSSSEEKAGKMPSKNAGEHQNGSEEKADKIPSKNAEKQNNGAEEKADKMPSKAVGNDKGNAKEAAHDRDSSKEIPNKSADSLNSNSGDKQSSEGKSSSGMPNSAAGSSSSKSSGSSESSGVSGSKGMTR